MSKWKALIVAISSLSVVLSGFSHVQALDTITVGEFNSNNTVRDLDVEYYVTGGTFSGTFSLTGNFDLPDGTIVTADPVYSGTCIPASGTQVSQNMQSCALTPRVNGQSTQYGHHESYLEFDDSSATLTMTGSPTTTQQVVVTKISYFRVQQITIRLNNYATGRLYVKYTGSGSDWYLEPVTNVSLYKTTRDNVTYIRCGISNSNFIQFNIVKPVTDLTSISTSSILSFDGTYINELVASEFPVSDESLLASQEQGNSLVQSILQILQENQQLQQEVQQTQQGVQTEMQSVGDVGDDMHDTEVTIHTGMQTALNDPLVKTDVLNKINTSTKLKAAIQWVSTQMDYIVTDMGTETVTFWTFAFILPLVIGMGLFILRRIK